MIERGLCIGGAIEQEVVGFGAHGLGVDDGWFVDAHLGDECAQVGEPARCESLVDGRGFEDWGDVGLALGCWCWEVVGVEQIEAGGVDGAEDRVVGSVGVLGDLCWFDAANDGAEGEKLIA